MKVFVASNMPTDYPYKLQKPSTINSRVRDTADEFIMDSGIGDEVTNEEVLELAKKYSADWVVGKDHLHNQDKTTKSILEFLELHNEMDIEATPMVPLQPPFDEHYDDLAGFDHYVLGGMAVDEVDTAQQIKWIRDFREKAPNVYAHGLGVGGGMEFVQKVARNDLLDSVDCATPEMAGQFGSILNERLRQKQIRVMNGEGASKRNIPLSEFNSYQLQDVWEREENKTGLEVYQ